VLRQHGYVEASFAARREQIEAGVHRVASEQAAGNAVVDPALLDEVTALNEWPVPLLGRFEERFLDVPPEALVSSMEEHQKYFHVVDANGEMLPCFITVANLESRDPQAVISGNEKVIRPRLRRRRFFYDTDRKNFGGSYRGTSSPSFSRKHWEASTTRRNAWRPLPAGLPALSAPIRTRPTARPCSVRRI